MREIKINRAKNSTGLSRKALKMDILGRASVFGKNYVDCIEVAVTFHFGSLSRAERK